MKQAAWEQGGHVTVDSSDQPAAQTSNETATPQKTSARDGILRAAEALFAQRGFNGASMREIATSAGVALSQLHYYFKSKQDLYFEVFQSRGGKITSERLRMLNELRAAHAGKPVPLSDLIAALVLPYLEHAQADGEAYVRLYSRLQTEDDVLARSIRSRIFDETTLQFVAEFRRALPQMPDDVLYWRIVYMMGTYNYALLRSGRLEAISRNTCDSSNMTEAARHIMPFLEAAMLAPWSREIG